MDQLTPTEITSLTKRVQALSPEQRNDLLFALVGRMSVSNPEALADEIKWSEANS